MFDDPRQGVPLSLAGGLTGDPHVRCHQQTQLRLCKTIPAQIVRVKTPDGSGLRERSTAQLSGGERRRVAIALALGFGELVRDRGRLRCNVLVLVSHRDPNSLTDCRKACVSSTLVAKQETRQRLL